MNVHVVVISSCNAWIVSLALDFAALYHSLCSLAGSIPVLLPLLCCPVPFTSASSQGWVCVISVVAFA